MKVTMTTISKRQRAHLKYIQKAKQISKQLYLKIYRHLAKSKTACVTYSIQEAKHFTVCDLS